MRDYKYWLSLESESIYHDIHSISLQIKFIGLPQMGAKTHTTPLFGNKYGLGFNYLELN